MSSKEEMTQFAAELYAIVSVDGCGSTQLTALINDLICDMRSQVWAVLVQCDSTCMKYQSS